MTCSERSSQPTTKQLASRQELWSSVRKGQKAPEVPCSNELSDKRKLVSLLIFINQTLHHRLTALTDL